MAFELASQTGGITSKLPSPPGRGGGHGAAQIPPKGEDAVNRPYEDELENDAQADAAGEDIRDEVSVDEDDDYYDKPSDQEFLKMVAEASAQAAFYSNQVNRRAWERAYKAYRQEHFATSKYNSNDFRNRSKLFIPKTRAAIRKDMAATMKSVFDTVDVIEVTAGNEADPMQKGSAAVMKELIAYRTDRANGRAAMPWFTTVMGSRQTSLLTGFTITKQSWKLEMRKRGIEDFEDEDGETRKREVWAPFIDRPDCQLIPPENVTIDPACDWTNPAQDSAYFIIRWPMRLDEIKQRQNDPRRPWKKIPESRLKAAGEGARMDAATIRRARDQGLDRFEQNNTGPTFDVIWVYETYIRTAGQDWTFFSLGADEMLTDPMPVEEMYPEQDGERPITMGYGSLEAFCVFPMAAAESWQMLQQEVNDVRNLTLDAFKQNVMPVTKVVRGKQIDLDQLKRRGQGSSIMVTNKDDVTWERPPDVPAAAQFIKQQLDIDFDDLAGQANYGTVQDNNALGKTLGGLKLAAGAANAVQEYDIRVWIETWAERALSQLVKLEQWYESDPVILGLVGDRAELLQKHGIDEITDELLEQSVTVRVSMGPGAGDPDARLQKFAQASTIAQPYIAMDPRFASGEITVDGEAIASECFGAAGFRDGGKRFFKKGQPKGPDPAAQAAIAAEGDKNKADAELKRAQAKKAVVEAMVKAAEMGIKIEGARMDGEAMRFDQSVRHMDQVGKAMELGHSQGLALKAAQMAAKGLNVDGTPIDMPGTPPGPDYPDGKVPANELGAMPAGAGEPAADKGGAPPSEPGGDAPQPGAAAKPFDMPAGMPTPKPEAGAAAPAESAPAKKKPRSIRITGRGPDGRANAFEVDD